MRQEKQIWYCIVIVARPLYVDIFGVVGLSMGMHIPNPNTIFQYHNKKTDKSASKESQT